MKQSLVLQIADRHCMTRDPATTRRLQSGLAGVVFALLLNGAVAVVTQHRAPSVALAILTGFVAAAAGATMGGWPVLGTFVCGALVIWISPDDVNPDNQVSDDIVYWMFLSGACVLGCAAAAARWAMLWFRGAHAAPLGRTR
jgi:hypothetical protein